MCQALVRGRALRQRLNGRIAADAARRSTADGVHKLPNERRGQDGGHRLIQEPEAATDVPRACAEACAQVIELARRVSPIGKSRRDLRTPAWLRWPTYAALRSAALNFTSTRLSIEDARIRALPARAARPYACALRHRQRAAYQPVTQPAWVKPGGSTNPRGSGRWTFHEYHDTELLSVRRSDRARQRRLQAPTRLCSSRPSSSAVRGPSRPRSFRRSRQSRRASSCAGPIRGPRRPKMLGSALVPQTVPRERCAQLRSMWRSPTGNERELYPSVWC